MNLSQTTLRMGAVLASIGAIVVLAASAQAATSKPAEMSQPEYRALMIRSEGLNTLYGNAVTRLSPQQFKGLYQAGANLMAPQEFAALVARSEGLNRQSGLDQTPQPAAVLEPSGSGSGFDWSDFGIGAAAMLGLVLLGGGLLTAAYLSRKSGARPRVT